MQKMAKNTLILSNALEKLSTKNGFAASLDCLFKLRGGKMLNT